MAQTTPKELSLAEKILNKYGGEVDDYFKLWPRDKNYFFSSDKQAYLAYAIKFKVAVCLFDPVGKDTSIKLLLTEFEKFYKTNKLTPFFVQTTDKYSDLYMNISLRGLLIGADALIDIDVFLKQTVKNKYFRNIVNRFNKNGFEIEESKPPHSKKLLEKLEKVSKDWLKIPHKKEWHFLTGRFSNEYFEKLPLYLLKNNERILAFSNGLPIYRKNVASVDLIRRRRDSPPNSVDFLFIKIMELMKKDRIRYFNIGMSPIDGAGFASSTQEKLLILFYKSSQSLIGFKGLHQFKSKYKPVWEPRYVFREKGVIKLIRAGLAIYFLMM